jgi:galactokinase
MIETITTNGILQEELENTRLLFLQYYGQTPATIGYAPGRINIIGEHTDYNQGLSLPTAINRWIFIGAIPDNKPVITVYSELFNQEYQFDITETERPKENWKKFVFGVVDLLRQQDDLKHGMKLFIHGNIPAGSGVSSSAAFSLALLHTCCQVWDIHHSELDMALLAQQVEHQYLHVKCGLLDQFASQFSKPDHYLFVDFQGNHHKSISSSLKDHQWVLTNTMVKRELASVKYSERVEECQKALEEIKTKDRHVHNFRDLRFEHLDLISSPVYQKRMKHYLTENERVKEMITALHNGNATMAGQLLNASHHSLQFDYEVSCDEADFISDQARRFGACQGSRIMGGGFGGCVLSLVRTNALEAFEKHIAMMYLHSYRTIPDSWVFKTSEGAGYIQLH